MNAPPLLLAAVEGAFNQYLALDEDAHQRLGQFEGKVIELEFSGLDLHLHLLPTASGIQVLGHYEGEADARIIGTPLAFLAMQKDREGTLFSGDIRVEGDTELGHRFQNLLNSVDVDWEEHLSHLTGDVIAHQIGRAIRGVADWGRRTRATLYEDLGDYLTEETRSLPTRYEVDEFLAAVDDIRSDADRMEARVKRLEARLTGK
jgi:ubiquinone biosynthesis protein UbiJ